MSGYGGASRGGYGPAARAGGGGGGYGTSGNIPVLRAPGSPGGYIANVKDLVNFQVNWNQWEVIKNSLYDSGSYAAAGTQQMTFFAVQVGQGTGFGGAAKTYSDTNMQLGGQLPSNQMFLISEIEIHFQPTTPTVAAQMPAAFGAEVVAAIVNDAYIFYRSGNLLLTIGAKGYLQEAPLMRFPPGPVFEVQGAVADVSSPAANLQSRIFFAGARGDPYILTPNNLLLVSSQNFNITLNWPEGVQAITNPARVFVVMNGSLYRKAQ